DVALGARLTVRGLDARAPASAELLGKRYALTRAGDSHLLVLGPQPRSARATLSLLQGGRRYEIHGVRVELGDREMGYPLLMGLVLPAGLLGLVIASLLAAFMSTIDTHTNWGASYLVQDVYKRFIRPDASERSAVRLSRLCIVLQAVLAGVSALFVTSIATVWRFLLGIGAGLGSVSAARWYWWRVTPHAEIMAMAVTTLLAVGLELFCTRELFGGPNGLFLFELPPWARLLTTAIVSLCVWVPVALWGPQNDRAALRRFAERVRPPGPGWRALRAELDLPPPSDRLLASLLRVGAGLVVVYGALFGVGMLLFGRGLLGVALVALAALMLGWILFGRRA
ncbi:MAG: hypothetical protein KC503_19760, partial [Myxococcales bacterium]|nr:hypothetical protein [Myxococcales bacterium]